MAITGSFSDYSIYLDGDVTIRTTVKGNRDKSTVDTHVNVKNPKCNLDGLIDALKETKEQKISYLQEKLPLSDMSQEEAENLADSVEARKSLELGSKEVVLEEGTNA